MTITAKDVKQFQEIEALINTLPENIKKMVHSASYNFTTDINISLPWMEKPSLDIRGLEIVYIQLYAESTQILCKRYTLHLNKIIEIFNF
jgi:hypothetical protein